MRRYGAGIAVIFAAMLSAAAPVPTGTLTLHVTNVRNAKGLVHADICPEALFLKDGCPFGATVPAQVGTTTITVHGIPSGQYAAQLFHDENANHKVDRALFGIPKEGVAFSRDAPIHLSPPKWAAAVFAFDGRDQTMAVKMRYMLGSSGPPQAH